MNKNKTNKPLIQEILEHLLLCGSSLIISSLFTPYGEGIGQVLRKSERIATSCPHNFSFVSKNTVSTSLSRLKRRGLITNNGLKKKAVWRITERGKDHFHREAKFSLPKDDGKMRLVIFDVPEAERRKRDWLRTRLLSYNYTQLQRSVWLGTRPLPEELLIELHERRLNSYVHIVGLEESLRFDKV